MLYRRKIYTIDPYVYDQFTHFFHTYLLPNQLTFGAKLIGRWVNENKTEIMALWGYKDKAHYEEVESHIRASELHKEAQEFRKTLPPLFLDSSQDFFTSTGHYESSKTIVSVSGYITNEEGHVLLVKNGHRHTTYEMPGGQLEPGETLKAAVRREVLEETGIEVEIDGITGVYHNMTSGVVCVVFHGRAVSGTPAPQPPETIDVRFVDLSNEDMEGLITTPQFLSRLKDAHEKVPIVYESFEVRPYRLVERIVKTSGMNVY